MVGILCGIVKSGWMSSSLNHIQVCENAVNYNRDIEPFMNDKLMSLARIDSTIIATNSLTCMTLLLVEMPLVFNHLTREWPIHLLDSAPMVY